MNRRQAGEDFYFIQKLIPAGGYFNLYSTTVYPSPRASSRVPFGTGASIAKLDTGRSSTILTYNILAFKELGMLFELIDTIFSCPVQELADQYLALPPGLRSFIDENDWTKKTAEIKCNTSGLISFRKRFFEWFNMFKIVKYLNHAHTRYFEKKPVDIAAAQLLKERGVILESSEPVDLLLFFRKLEKMS
jgi:hypothetical protein